MKKSPIVTVLALTLSCPFWGQAGREKVATEKPNESSAELLLRSAQAQSGRFEPPMRASIDFASAYIYKKSNAAQSKQFLRNAYQLVANLGDSDAIGISMLQGEIINQMAQQDPDVLEKYPPANDNLRNLALRALVERELMEKKYQSALDDLQRMDKSPDVDLAAASILSALPKEDKADRERAFTWELDVFKQKEHGNVTAAYPADLGSVVVRFWKQLPPGLVHEAIDELLTQAKPENLPTNSQAASAIPSVEVGGMVQSFNSYYEFRAYQLQPVLKQIDPAEADELLSKNADAASVLQAASTRKDSAQGPNAPSLAAVYPQDPAAMAQLGQDAQRASSIQIIEGEAKEHPHSAIERASAIADGLTREDALLALADDFSAKRAFAATEALERLLATMDGGMRPEMQIREMEQAAGIAIRIKEPALAAKAISKGLKSAAALYKNDSNPDDPNMALKLYWPSTAAWRDLIALQYKVSPDDALATIKELPDPEIQALQEVYLASSFMNVPLWQGASPIEEHKSELANR